MRNILIIQLFMFFLLQIASAQTDSICGVLPIKNGKIIYSDIVNFDSIKAEQLFVNTKIWISESFGSAKAVTESEVENSFIAIKGFVKLQNDNQIEIDFLFNFYFKNGGLKYEVKDLFMRIPSVKINTQAEKLPAFKNCQMETVNKFDISLKSLIENYLNRMKELSQAW